MRWYKLCIWLMVFVLAACTGSQPVVEKKPPPAAKKKTLEDIVSEMSTTLLIPFASEVSNGIVIVPFIEQGAGYTLKDHEQLSVLFEKQLRGKFTVLEYNNENIAQSAYVLAGLVQSQANKTTLQALVFNAKTGVVTANAQGVLKQNAFADVMLADRKHPLFYAITYAKQLEQAFQSKKISQFYLSSLVLFARIHKAKQAYAQKDLDLAKTIYTTTDKFSRFLTNKNLQTLVKLIAATGLYMVDVEKKRNVKQLVTSSVISAINIVSKAQETIALKLAYKKGTADFKDDPDLLQNYALWGETIAILLQKNRRYQLEIIGHASATKNSADAVRLSLKRALGLKNQILSFNQGLAQRISVIGKGDRENVIGSGGQNFQDRVDRRIELRFSKK